VENPPWRLAGGWSLSHVRRRRYGGLTAIGRRGAAVFGGLLDRIDE
jgi:hypothetical protein